MSSKDSSSEQSEDGELQQSPIEENGNPDQISLSGEENDNGLDIKPPQLIQHSSKSKKRSSHESYLKRRSDRHREERLYYREKNKDRHARSSKEHYQQEKERYYREKKYESEGYETMEREYREHKKQIYSQYADSKYDERKSKSRYSRELEKHRKARYEEEKRDSADKALQDLRERLLSKRTSKEHEEYKSEKYEKHRRSKDFLDSALKGEAGAYVKEIINISTNEKRHRRIDKNKDDNSEEKLEQDLRREKLLEAEREMARYKEQREKRYQERTIKRQKDEEKHKPLRADDSNVVTVSDNTESEVEETYEKASEESVHSQHSGSSRKSSPSRRSPVLERAYTRRSRSRTRSRSVSKSRSRSRSFGSEGSGKNSIEKIDDSQPDNSTNKENDDNDSPKINEDLPPYYPAIQGCRSVEEFQCLNRIEEGTYGVVYRAKDKRTEEIVALKRLKMEKEKEGFPITSLREINTLLKGQHPNIVTVREIVVGSNMDKIFIVMDYVEHDLKSLMETMRHKKQNFMPGEIKCLLRQLLLAVSHLHDNWILHRDLKTSNLLLSHKGILKVGDFGLAREYGSPLKAYTPIVVTLWYRAPELLLCTKEYSTPIDMWSVGCIFAELLLMNAVFPGKSEVDQLNRVFKDLGTPSEKIWPGFNQLPAVKKMKFTEYPISNLRSKFSSLSEIGLSLLTKFLTYDPSQRVTAEQALKHAYFDEPPLPIDPAMFPTWPAKSELGLKRAMAASPKPPSGGGEYKKLRGDGDDDAYGFRLGMGVSNVLDNRRGGAGFSLKF